MLHFLNGTVKSELTTTWLQRPHFWGSYFHSIKLPLSTMARNLGFRRWSFFFGFTVFIFTIPPFSSTILAFPCRVPLTKVPMMERIFCPRTFFHFKQTSLELERSEPDISSFPGPTAFFAKKNL